jgi:hypothetical protein
MQVGTNMTASPAKRKPTFFWQAVLIRVDWKLLRSMSPKAGTKSAEELVREDRDARP